MLINIGGDVVSEVVIKSLKEELKTISEDLEFCLKNDTTLNVYSSDSDEEINELSDLNKALKRVLIYYGGTNVV
jgi:hypothetical protein